MTRAIKSNKKSLELLMEPLACSVLTAEEGHAVAGGFKAEDVLKGCAIIMPTVLLALGGGYVFKLVANWRVKNLLETVGDVFHTECQIVKNRYNEITKTLLDINNHTPAEAAMPIYNDIAMWKASGHPKPIIDVPNAEKFLKKNCNHLKGEASRARLLGFTTQIAGYEPAYNPEKDNVDPIKNPELKGLYLFMKENIKKRYATWKFLTLGVIIGASIGHYLGAKLAKGIQNFQIKSKP